MIDYQLNRENGVLVVHPEGPLEASDFDDLRAEVDGYIEAYGRLKGLVIVAKAFPGWKDLKSAIAHFRFIEHHHEKIEKVAFVSDSTLLAGLPEIAAHFVNAEVKHFETVEESAALAWVQA